MIEGRLAVVMPFKNSVDTVGTSAALVLMQNGCSNVDVRLIAVDDGSTDGSAEILRGIDPERVIVLKGHGAGPALARNVALDHIRRDGTYDYVAFCDSDDQWFPWHLNRSLTALSNADMVYSDVEGENEKGEPIIIYGIPRPENFDHALLKQGNYIFISTVVMKSKCLSVGNFDPDAVPMEDWEYWLRVSDKYKVHHINNPKPGAVYMWKSTGSYYTAEESQSAKQRIIKKMNITDPSNIEGWLSKEEGEFLAFNAEGRKCIEIGSYKGKSTNYIASRASSVICIDTFKADGGGQNQNAIPTTYVDFAANTAHLDNVTALIGLSQDVHPLLRNNEFDFIFIDGMHDYESVMNDVMNYLPKLKDGAVIMFHDYFERDWPGVVMCVNQLFGKPDELIDTTAKVVLTPERRFDLSMIFSGMSLAKSVMGGPDIEPVPDMDMSSVEMVEAEKPLAGKVILVAPWSSKLPNNQENPKNYPYWTEVIRKLRSLGAYTIHVGVAGERMVGCDEMRLNCKVESLKFLLDASDTFVSVDTFLPHFAAYHGKKGVTIFGKSDPEIFGHSLHTNLLKSREYLRPDQFRWWRDVSADNAAFVPADQVVAAILEILKPTEIYNEPSEKI